MNQFRIERHGDDSSTIYVNGTPAMALSDKHLADLSAACLSALREQEPKCSPTVFTEIADAPEHMQCAPGCELVDDPVCGRPFSPHEEYPELCGNDMARNGKCLHLLACHAEGKDNG